MWILLEICDNFTVPADTEALKRRLSPTSPLIVAMDYAAMSAGAERYVIPDVLQGMPSCLTSGAFAATRTAAFSHHLGSPQADSLLFSSLEQDLCMQNAVHWFALADWLLAQDFCKQIASWVLKQWLEDHNSFIADLKTVAEPILHAALRAGLLQMASISESALLELANSSGHEALMQVFLTSSQESQASWGTKEAFPVFVKLSGRTIVVDACTDGMTVYTLKESAAMAFSVPPLALRLAHQSKPLEDTRCLQQYGIQRDSTIRAYVVPGVNDSPMHEPYSVSVKFFGSSVPGGHGEEQTVSIQARGDEAVSAVAMKALFIHRGGSVFSPVFSSERVTLYYGQRELCPEKPIGTCGLPGAVLLHAVLSFKAPFYFSSLEPQRKKRRKA